MPNPPVTLGTYGLWCISFLLFTFYYFLLRRLPLTKAEIPVRTQLPDSLKFTFEKLDYISLTILCILTAVWWIGYQYYPPCPPDSIYHLLVAQHILDDGSIPLWNYWEYAPIGRPHLYPPLYHLMLAGCAMLCKGNVLMAFRILQPFMLPFSYFCTWLLARWLFGARRAFFTLLLLGSDLQFSIIGGMATPSLLAGAFVTLMVLFFLSGHILLAILMGTLSAYAHISILPMALTALTIFSLWQRIHRLRLFVLISTVLLSALPVIAWLWVNHNAFKHPIETQMYSQLSPVMRLLAKLSWLQMINLGIGLIAFHAIRHARWRDPANQLLLIFLTAFLPMLISYGGRYFVQTMGLWCILAAGFLADWNWHPLTLRRKLKIGLLPFLPSIILVGSYVGIPSGPIPLPSAWCLPPAAAVGAARLILDGKTTYAYTDIMRAGDYIRATTTPDTILLTQEKGVKVNFLLFPLALYAHRKTNMGVWEETEPSPQAMDLLKTYVNNYREKACYITFSSEALPPDVTKRQFGTIWIGIRQLPLHNHI